MHHNYIAIEGTIGAGKTSLANMMAADFNGNLVLEEFEESKNPFLPKFYANPSQYAFQLEMTFLALRYQQLKDRLSTLDMFSDFVIADYYAAKSLVFSRNNLQEDEYELFARFYGIVFSTMPKPDLLVYLYRDVENLQQNIRKRGRGYEQSISDEYLSNIQQGYMEFLRQQQNEMSILLLDVNNIDFVADKSDYQRVVEAIDKPYPMGVNRVIL